MENQPINIYGLYSSFSQKSKALLESIKSNNLDFITLIKIDSSSHRNLLKNKIQEVPSVIVESSDGNIEVFEGNKAFMWLSDVISNKQKNDMEQKYRMEQEKILDSMNQMKLQNEILMKEIEKKNAELETQKTTEKVSKDFTNINDVIETPENNLPSQPIQPPPVQPSDRNEIQPRKNQDVLARARELEKGRELDISNKKPHNI